MSSAIRDRLLVSSAIRDRLLVSSAIRDCLLVSSAIRDLVEGTAPQAVVFVLQERATVDR